ncbi:MAG: HIT family protein [Nanoarchaeota archaeon]
MTDCLFCKIIKREIPSDIVYEDDKVIAFLDIHPVNKGHTLVLPKQHYENLFDVPENILINTMKTVKKIAVALSKYSDGVNVGQNNRMAAGQLVDHIHFHLIPRFNEDGLKHWPGKKYQEGESKKVADEIKKLL